MDRLDIPPLTDSESDLRRAAKLARRIEKHFEEQRNRHKKKELRKQSRAQRAGRKERPRQRWTPQDIDDDALDPELVRTRHGGGAKRPTAKRGEDSAPSALLAGQVIGIARKRCRVRTEQGDHEAELTPAQPSLIPAVGDFVELEEHGEHLRIASRQPRASWLSRRDPGAGRRERILAANLDIATIVVAAEAFGIKTRLIDRFVVVALSGNVRPIVTVNKVDQVTAEQLARIARELEPYRAIGLEVHLVSALRGDGMAALRSTLQGELSAFVGPSGVGKTSIVNAFAPELARDIGAVRATDGRGRHTTTASELFELADGVRIVDTPGIRQLALFDLLPADVDVAFPELSPTRLGCRFANCRHASEPGCGAREAIEQGHLHPARLDSYARILAALEGG